jgi:uncharacterized DUF497 family protein
MDFEWDEAKSDANLARRGFDFNFATIAFLDENRVDASARTHKRKQRFSVIGKVKGVILFVVYTWRFYENKKRCRIISAREASRAERSRYSALR